MDKGAGDGMQTKLVEHALQGLLIENAANAIRYQHFKFADNFNSTYVLNAPILAKLRADSLIICTLIKPIRSMKMSAQSELMKPRSVLLSGLANASGAADSACLCAVLLRRCLSAALHWRIWGCVKRISRSMYCLRRPWS